MVVLLGASSVGFIEAVMLLMGNFYHCFDSSIFAGSWCIWGVWEGCHHGPMLVPGVEEWDTVRGGGRRWVAGTRCFWCHNIVWQKFTIFPMVLFLYSQSWQSKEDERVGSQTKSTLDFLFFFSYVPELFPFLILFFPLLCGGNNNDNRLINPSMRCLTWRGKWPNKVEQTGSTFGSVRDSNCWHPISAWYHTQAMTIFHSFIPSTSYSSNFTILSPSPLLV